MNKTNKNRIRSSIIILVILIYSFSLIQLINENYGSHFLAYWLHALPPLIISIFGIKELVQGAKKGKLQNVHSGYLFFYNKEKDKFGFWSIFATSIIIILVALAFGIALLIIPFI